MHMFKNNMFGLALPLLSLSLLFSPLISAQTSSTTVMITSSVSTTSLLSSNLPSQSGFLAIPIITGPSTSITIGLPVTPSISLPSQSTALSVISTAIPTIANTTVTTPSNPANSTLHFTTIAASTSTKVSETGTTVVASTGSGSASTTGTATASGSSPSKSSAANANRFRDESALISIAAGMMATVFMATFSA